MTDKETTIILLKLHGAYFSQDRFADSQEFEHRAAIWGVYFADFPYSVVNKVVTEWIATRKEMPQISELLPRCKDERTALQSLKDPENIKPTHEIIYLARHGEPPEKPEVSRMIDRIIEEMRKDPKIKAIHEAHQKQQENKNFLPYEI